ncbi:MAG: protein kinase [Polyangiaceae bacterium]
MLVRALRFMIAQATLSHRSRCEKIVPLSLSKMTLDLSAPTSLLGVIINQKYKLLGQIGEGGMGRVFKAEQLPLGRPVAIKILRPTSEQEGDDAEVGAFEKRFFLEASTLSKLQHPNLVAVFDYGEIEGNDTPTFFMAMEFLAGETLHKRIRARKRLPAKETISIVRQIARGLHEAHSMGLVHRDLKPGNVMIVPEHDDLEIVKVVDFGLVKVLEGSSEELTQAGTFLGSPTYIPPEQVRGAALGTQADLYSLGVVFYEMLAGVPPFQGTTIELLLAQVNKRPPSFASRVEGLWVPPALEKLVMRCLEKNPESRPQGMDGFLAELKECEAALDGPPASLSATRAPTSAPGSKSSGVPSVRTAGSSGSLPAVNPGLASTRAPTSGPTPALAPTSSRSGQYKTHPATIPGPDESSNVPKLPPPPALPRDSLASLNEDGSKRMSDRAFYTLIAIGSLVVMGLTFVLLMKFAR